jgi:hypothetical protein
MLAIALAAQRQDGDSLILGVDDPVFGDAGLGVVSTLDFGVV